MRRFKISIGTPAFTSPPPPPPLPFEAPSLRFPCAEYCRQACHRGLVGPGAFSIARSGTSGFVQLAFNLETGEQVAIKFIERGAHMQRIVARELLNHRLCALHPHIVQLKVRLVRGSCICTLAHVVDTKRCRATCGWIDLPGFAPLALLSSKADLLPCRRFSSLRTIWPSPWSMRRAATCQSRCRRTSCRG